MEVKKSFKILIYGIILIALIGTLIGLSVKVIDNLIYLFISLGIGLVFSAICGGLIELFSDDNLKNIFWIVDFEVFDFEFHIPISLFTISTILLKILIFK
ncbi:MAG: hypothetical protein KBA47_00520 [Caldisericia bacterium]|nr:hypothetical protein [Caldisericia bacterium]